jgi:predicted transcriptional regulator
MQTQAETKPMSIKLSVDERERLKRLAGARKRTPHWLAKEAIAQFLDREEAGEKFRQESIAAWDAYQRTGESIPNEKVMTWLDTWGDEDEAGAPSCR